MPREFAFEVEGDIRGAVRTVRSDTWKPRPAVDRYYLWRDLIRLARPKQFTEYPAIVRVICFFPMPESWSKAKREFFGGRPYIFTPDSDNICKGILDACWEKDQMIYHTESKAFFSSHAKTGHCRIIVVEHDEKMIHFLKTGKIK